MIAIAIISILCLTALIAYVCKLRYDYKMSYVDEPTNEQGTYVNTRTGVPTSTWQQYKRTYKNGTVTYIEKIFGE